MSETTPSHELSSEAQLQFIQDYIHTQTAAIPPYDNDDMGYPMQIREAHSVQLSSTVSANYSVGKAVNGEGPDVERINIGLPHEASRSLFTTGTGDETLVGVIATEEDTDLFEHFDVPLEEALQMPQVHEVIAVIYEAIQVGSEEEVEIIDLPDLTQRLLIIEASEDHERSAVAEVGVAMQPKGGFDQDAALVDYAQDLYGIFDGKGGALKDPNNGPRSERADSKNAARLGAAVVQRYMADMAVSDDPEVAAVALADALKATHQNIVAAHNSDSDRHMGATTGTVMKIVTVDSQKYAAWASVGDSRLYVHSPDGETQLITRNEGEGSVVLNILGTRGGFSGVTQFGVVPLQEGSQIFLGTDGITGDKEPDLLSTHSIATVLENAPSAQVAAERLIEISSKNDDKAGIVVRV